MRRRNENKPYRKKDNRRIIASIFAVILAFLMVLSLPNVSKVTYAEDEYPAAEEQVTQESIPAPTEGVTEVPTDVPDYSGADTSGDVYNGEDFSAEPEYTEPATEYYEDPYANLLTLESLYQLPETSVDATIQGCDYESAVKDYRTWTANIFYLYQEDTHHVDKSENFNLKYEMEFRSAAYYAPYSVEIRIPLGPVKYGTNEKNAAFVTPSEIAVPEGSYDKVKNEYTYKESEKTNFNYYIDKEKDEIVFFNYADIAPYTVNAWQMLYKDIDVAKTLPDSNWSFVPEINVINGEITEHLEKDELTPVTGFVTKKAEEQPVNTEEQEIKNSNPRSVEDLAKLPEDEAGAIVISNETSNKKLMMYDSESGDLHFDVYYMNQQDPHYVFKTDDFTLKYQMEFHNDVNIDPFEVQVRVPVSAVLYGHSNAGEEKSQVLPTDIGIPEGSYDKETGQYTYTETRKSDFNYYIDEETNEFVFFNYKFLPAASDNAWQVLYKDYNVMEIEDQFSWTIKPTVTALTTRAVKDPETGEDMIDPETGETVTEKVQETIDVTTPLTGLVDTGIQLQQVSKNPYKEPGKQYTPGLYTKKQVSTYAPNAANVVIPGTTEKLYDHFDEYVYVVWETTIRGYATQPYDLLIADTLTQITPTSGQENPNGFIVGFKEVGGETKTNVDYGQPENVGVYNAEEYSKERILSKTYRVVSAYPRDSVIVNQTILHNNTYYSMQPFDEIDYSQSQSADAYWVYVDYDWRYQGDIIGVRKNGSPANLNSWITTYELINQTEDLPTANFSVNGTCRSFALTHELSKTKLGNYIPGKYAKVTTVDDAVYAFPVTGSSEAGTPYKLGKEDYYFNTVTARISDRGYDVYEDELSGTVPVSETTFTDPEYTIDRDLHVYAMFALDENGNPKETDEWEEVGVVPWSSSGSASYTFTADQIAREPWRVKMEHISVDYVSYSYIDLNISIKGDSPVFRSFPEDVDVIRLENICGIMGEEFSYDTSRGYFQDTTIEGKYSEEHNPGLIDQTQDLYGTILMRDNAFTNLLRESLHAHASKTGTAYNDRENSRAKVRYRMEASEGYKIFSPIAIEYIERAGEPTPHRSEVVFYDLLPFGVQFDPSGTIVAGRLQHPSTNTGIVSEEGTWDKSQVEVSVDPQTDIILNYHNTGRTLVAFHVYYTGRDSTKYASGEWFTGFGLAFDAYCDYEDYSSATERPNIVAYMPGKDDLTPIFGTDTEVSYDDGNVVSSDGMDYYYREMGADINGDGRTDTHNVLYAQSQVFSDIAIASQAKLDKLVRADDDPFGVYKESTTVLPGMDYEYKISVMNTSPISLESIVVFDRIENSIKDRAEQEPGQFDSKDWKGTFKGVNVAELRSAGITPVVYYNANRDAVIPEGDQNPYDVLTEENGWILEEDWATDLSEVHAVAVDISAYGFQLEPESNASFLIRMTAPSEMPADGAAWAYNNASFYSMQQGASALVVGNSIKTKIVEAKKLELEKQLAEGVPPQRKNDDFKFTLSWSDGTTTYPYSYKTYSLMEKYMNPDTEREEWVRQNGLYATDASGSLYLKEGQKAVFEDLDAENIIIKEEDSLRWTLEDPTLTGTIEDGVRTVEAVNIYRPILYVQKNVTGYTASDKSAVNLEEFRLQLTDATGNPVANKELYVVSRAMTNGDEPTIIDGTHKLYGNLERPAVIPAGERTLKTDENGWFTIYAQETIAIPMNSAGDMYKIVEDPACYADTTNWIGQKTEDSGILTVNGTLLSVTNQYRWKQLNITKSVTNAGNTDVSEEEFTFKIYQAADGVKGAQITDFVWKLEDSESDEWNQPGADGEITAACVNKNILVSRFRAGTELIVEEVLTGELLEKYEATTGSVDLVIPIYASAGRASFVNNYLYRDLKVEKTAVSADQSVDLTQVPFTMYLETAPADSDTFVPAAGKEYNLYNSETGELIEKEDGTPWVTAEDGSFTVFGNTYAYFTNLDKLGVQWRTRELADPVYPPLAPQVDEASTIEIPDPDDPTQTIEQKYTEYLSGVLGNGENKASFINGGDGILILKKKWIADDSLSQQYLDYNTRNMYVNLRIYVEGFDTSYSDLPFEVVASHDAYLNYGSDYDSVSHRYRYYHYVEMYSKDSYLILRAKPSIASRQGFDFSSLEYTIVEQPNYNSSSGNNIWTIYGYGPFNGRIFYVNPGEGQLQQTGTPGEKPEVTFENHLSTFESIIQKRVEGNSVPEGKTLTWRVERFTNGAWEPAEGISYAVTSRSYTGQIMTPSGNVYVEQPPIANAKGETGTDGLIRMTTQDDFLASGIYQYPGSTYTYSTAADIAVMFYDKVYVDLKEGEEGDLRVVEVPEESDEEWGVFKTYITSEWYPYNLSPQYSSSPVPDLRAAKGFVNTNKKQTLKVEKVVENPDDTVFHFTLEYYKDSFEGEELAPGANIPYAVYDAETGEILYHSVTDPKGGFTLLGGQYAIFDVVPNRKWKITEESALPYYVEAIEVDGEFIENPGNSGEVNQVPDYENILKSNMLKGNLYPDLYDLLSRVSTPEVSYIGDAPFVRNIYFGTPSDYPDVISDTYAIMDTYYTGSIRAYAKPMQSEEYPNNYCDVYILSDDLMYMNTNCTSMFSGLPYLENVYFSNIDSSKTRDMSGMFGYDRALKNLYGTELLNTENVTSMASMFYECNNLETLDTSWLDTGNVQNMYGMFQNCYRLSDLDLSNFDTSKVIDMGYMFASCGDLINLDLTSFDTSSVQNMRNMFSNCNELQTLDLTSFDTSKVYDMTNMFNYDYNLEHIYASEGWTTNNVGNSGGMFTNCNRLPNFNSNYTDKTNAYIGDPTGYLECLGTVTVVSNNESLGTVAGDVENQPTATLQATPAENAGFTGWYLDDQLLSKSPEYVYHCTTPQPVTIEGRFTTEQVNVTVLSENDELGTVSGPSTVFKGEEFQISATPIEGYGLEGWYINGEKVSTKNPYTLSVEEDTVVTAKFVDRWVTVDLKPFSTYGWTDATVTNPTEYRMYQSDNVGRHSTNAVMKVTVMGYETYTLYINSYAESSYDYTIVSPVDASSYSTYNYNSSMCTQSFQYNPIYFPDSWKTITLTMPDTGEHSFYITYRKDGSQNSYNDRGYVLLPDAP